MKGNRYQGGLSTKQDLSHVKIEPDKVLSKDQRRDILQTISRLQSVLGSSNKGQTLYNLSEVFRTVHRIGQELNKNK